MDAVLGGIPWAAVVLASTMIIIDYFFGIAVAAIKKELTSAKMREGLLHKVCLFLVLIAGIIIKWFFLLVQIPESMIDVFGLSFVLQLFGVETIVEIPACVFVCTAIMLMETFSILENFARINTRAAQLLSHFQRLIPNDKEKKEGKDESDQKSK